MTARTLLYIALLMVLAGAIALGVGVGVPRLTSSGAEPGPVPSGATISTPDRLHELQVACLASGRNWYAPGEFLPNVVSIPGPRAQVGSDGACSAR